MTSYEELPPEMRKQVDNTSRLIAEDHHWAAGGWLSEDNLRERIAECVMTCVDISHKWVSLGTPKPKPTIPINKRRGKFYY